MPSYNPAAIERVHDPLVRDELLHAARDFGATGRERLALIEAAIVESNCRNLPGGHANSEGVLQQRAPWWGTHEQRTDPYKAALMFLKAARPIRKRKPWLTAGPLAQAVQRSAYPLRYALAYRAAKHLIALGEKRSKP